ncbi:MAG: glycosyltransferase family 9 protein [Deltaproteobacteria bacterium]|nr:glycosyltransferase family 9 protein [Deltaproteobacteria bacterium]
MNILIIQILRIGDALQLVPVIKGIKQVFPQSRLCLLTSRLGASILGGQEEIDEIFTLHKEQMANLLITGNKEDILLSIEQLRSDLHEVGAVKWDWVINFSYTFSSALLSFILDAKHRSGFTANKNRQYLAKEKWFAYSLASFMNRRYSNFNWVDINKNILGLPSVPHPPLIVPKHGDVARVSALLQKAGFENKKILGLHPGASRAYKRWPLQKFADLGRAFVQKHGYKVIIFGDETEKGPCKQLKSYIGNDAEDLSGQTTLDELKAFFSLCDVLVTNDTGPMHLASAVGTRIVSLFFSTHFIETGPYGAGHIAVHPAISCFPCQSTVKCPHKKCLNYISPETIETIILNRKALESNSDTDFLGRDKGMVKVYRSAFDPWGNLEWTPLGKNPMTFEDVERILLKTTWLYHCNVINSSNNTAHEYVLDRMALYGDPADRIELLDDLEKLLLNLSKFSNLLDAGCRVCLDIQTQLLKVALDRPVVESLGKRLTALETELSALGDGSSVSFLTELLTVLRENIEQTDILRLSAETARLYRDMKVISQEMIQRAKEVSALLGDRV